MRKRMILLTVILVICMVLCACSRGGNASEVQMITGDSELFTQREIEQAMETAMNHFRREFDGCTMTKIEYNESKSKAAALEWAVSYEADEAIVLYSSFDVDASGGDGSLNPNSSYHNWQWILTRDAGGNWVLRTWGYG